MSPSPPRPPDMLEARRLELAGILGADPLRDWDDLMNAVRCLRRSSDVLDRHWSGITAGHMRKQTEVG